jgi:2-keto-4-pentenoate hydratase/2-oxohepta-3-ene-1,7-dioic acid hydratase in catechol pathway
MSSPDPTGARVSVEHWCRVEIDGHATVGRVADGRIALYDGDLFDGPVATGKTIAANDARWLAPVQPNQFLGLWNNFHERRQVEGTQLPDHPLYFVKLPGCVNAHDRSIPVPPGDHARVKFEAELGIVIGRPCFRPSPTDIDAAIFGYTCVNDVTAGHVLFSNGEFQQWSRAKSWPGFGPIGPVIAHGIEPSGLRVRALLDGEVRQDYAVDDMIFAPRDIVRHIAAEIPLYPGDVIACGTSVGADVMAPGQRIEVEIAGIGTLRNQFG